MWRPRARRTTTTRTTAAARGEEDARARARAPVEDDGERGERGERLAFYDFDFTTTPSLSEDVLGTT